jgi:hypothetical protein
MGTDERPGRSSIAMPKYRVNCTCNFVGLDTDVVVNADNESEAEAITREWWQEYIMPEVGVEEEIEDNEEGYEEIN